jgi:hypothetical protein
LPRRISHWTLLAVVATLNLLLWVGLAVALGLLVSDKVDLGVETLIRQRQPTVVAAWKEAFSQAPVATAAPEPAGAGTITRQAVRKDTAVPSGAAVPNPSTAQTPDYEQANPTLSPEVLQAGPKVGTPTPAALPAGITQTPGTLPRATSTAAPPVDQPTALPEPTLMSQPLLMANPQLGNPARLNQEMEQSAAGRAVQIRYSETALNQEFQTLLQNNPKLPYRNVYLDLKRDRVIITGDVTALGLQVGAEVVSTVGAEDCMPRLEIESISIEGVFTPRFVRDKIRALVLEALDWYPADHPLCVEQIVLEEDGATVYGHRR